MAGRQIALVACCLSTALAAPAAPGAAGGGSCATEGGCAPGDTDDTLLLQARARHGGGSGAPAERRVMRRHLMTDKGLDSDVGAVCLDGSPGAFYFSPGVGEHKNDWLIFLEGGGWCTTPWDCYVARANVTLTTSLGSSKGYEEIAPTWMNKGINSMNCSISPFCNFNQVYVRYCDGTSYSGNLNEPVRILNSAYQEMAHVYFRGQRIFDAVVDTLLEDPAFGLSSGRNVLLSGCSAGGLGATLHADYLHDRLRRAVPTLQKYATAPTSGFFLRQVNVVEEPIYPSQLAQLFALSNWTTLSPKCAAANLVNPNKCNFAQFLLPHIESRFFLINSALDWWQTRCVLADELWDNGRCRQYADWQACASNITKCSGTQLAGMNSYMDAFMDAVEGGGAKTVSRPGNGAFINACHYHCEGQEDAPFTTFAVNGVTIRDAVRQWWGSEDPAAAHVHAETCRYSTGGKCNPTCTVFKDFLR